MIRKHIEKIFCDGIDKELFNTTYGTSTSSSQNTSLDLNALQKIIDELFPVLYYGTSQTVKKGEAYFLKQTDHSPECIIINPEDLERIKKLLENYRTLVHIKDEPKDKRQERILKNFKKYGSGCEI